MFLFVLTFVIIFYIFFYWNGSYFNTLKYLCEDYFHWKIVSNSLFEQKNFVTQSTKKKKNWRIFFDTDILDGNGSKEGQFLWLKIKRHQSICTRSVILFFLWRSVLNICNMYPQTTLMYDNIIYATRKILLRFEWAYFSKWWHWTFSILIQILLKTINYVDRQNNIDRNLNKT